MKYFKSYSLHAAAAVVFAAAAFSMGCGPPSAPVSGQVVIDGNPVSHGFIRIVPAEERAVDAKLDANGKFAIEECPLGTHKVSISAFEEVSGGQKWHAPKKYVDHLTSELTIQVDGPTENAEVELTWDGKKPFIEKYGSE